MNADEAFKVLNSVKHDLYPPTNPSVLLSAALFFYRQGNYVPQDIARILAWTLEVIRRNSPDAIAPPVQDAIVGLDFSFIHGGEY